MVRNAGGRVLDAIRTLAILQTIGNPGTIVVMHHTGKLGNRLQLCLKTGPISKDSNCFQIVE